MIVGFQAGGTLGRRLVDGARQVSLFGVRLPVRASIHTIGGLSAHADQAALLEWMGYLQEPPRQTFVVHGEAEAASELARVIEMRLDWPAPVVPLARRPYRLR